MNYALVKQPNWIRYGVLTYLDSNDYLCTTLSAICSLLFLFSFNDKRINLGDQLVMDLNLKTTSLYIGGYMTAYNYPHIPLWTSQCICTWYNFIQLQEMSLTWSLSLVFWHLERTWCFPQVFSCFHFPWT